MGAKLTFPRLAGALETLLAQVPFRREELYQVATLLHDLAARAEQHAVARCDICERKPATRRAGMPWQGLDHCADCTAEARAILLHTYQIEQAYVTELEVLALACVHGDVPDDGCDH